MKLTAALALLTALLLAAPAARAALTIPSDGSDGVFAPAASVEVDLSLAPTGLWDANNAANAGKGIYDPAKWAVVFKFSSINIPAGVTVTFKNHPSRAPVVWLVSGNVTIAGTVDIRGKNGASGLASNIPSEPGPGGFRGGAASSNGVNNGTGYGIGGGSNADAGAYAGAYGNLQILPLMGGSGSSVQANMVGGNAGSGAILIASALNLTVTGTITSAYTGALGYVGSGGAIKLIGEQVSGNGVVRANFTASASKSDGRLRIETSSLSPSLVTLPATAAVPPANPPVIWPSATAPTVRVLSIDGVAAPADPRAEVTSDQTPDAVIATTTVVTVLVQTTNFPTSGVVQVRDVAKYGNATWRTATLVAGGTYASANWSVSAVFPNGYTTLQAKATVP